MTLFPVSKKDGRTIASIRSSWTLAPEVWAGPLSEWTKLTHANDALKPLWGKTQNLHWRSATLTSRDG